MRQQALHDLLPYTGSPSAQKYKYASIPILEQNQTTYKKMPSPRDSAALSSQHTLSLGAPLLEAKAGYPSNHISVKLNQGFPLYSTRSH